MLLVLNKIKKMYSPFLVSVVHITYFIVLGEFSGVCCSYLWMKSRLDTAFSKDLDREAVFSPKFKSVARFFPPTQRRIVHWSPFPVGLEKFGSNSNDFCLTKYGACNFPMQLVTVQQTMAQLDINMRHQPASMGSWGGGFIFLMEIFYCSPIWKVAFVTQERSVGRKLERKV